jgi:hypothetical protein
MSNRIKYAILCAVAMLFGSCNANSGPKVFRPVTPQVIRTVFGGQETYDVFKAAQKVSACRLEVKKETLESHSGDYEYLEGAFVELSSEQTAQVRKILESPDSYEFDLRKACTPLYGVRLRFEGESNRVDVDLCFSCDILLVSRDGKPMEGGNFDPIRPNLVALCKKLFPNDKEIQQLAAEN